MIGDALLARTPSCGAIVGSMNIFITSPCVGCAESAPDECCRSAPRSGVIRTLILCRVLLQRAGRRSDGSGCVFPCRASRLGSLAKSFELQLKAMQLLVREILEVHELVPRLLDRANQLVEF